LTVADSRRTILGDFFRKFFEVRGIRFLLVGGLNSLFGFAVFSLLAYLGAHTWQALLGSNLAGILFNFFTIGGVVFRDLGLSRAPRFALAYLCIYLVNLESIRWLSSQVQMHQITAQALLTAPMAIISYVVMSRFVFFRKITSTP